MAKTAIEFEKIIKTDRSRKKNEALAAKIFGKDRRASNPVKAAGPAGSGKLATRAGVKKRAASSSVAPPRSGNINSEWTHDLHDGGNTRKNNASAAALAAPGSLASRISQPGQAPKAQKRGAATAVTTAAAPSKSARRQQQQQQQRALQVANALSRAEQAAKPVSGLSIRGIAAAVNEPLVVMAQNFAPGTTAADIESAVTPVGGLVSSCRILKTTPIVIAEMVFESREGAGRVIETFNNQTADGRVLQVYPKTINGNDGGVLTPHSDINMPAAPRAMTRGKNYTTDDDMVDGPLGYDDPMDTDRFEQRGGGGNRNGAANDGYNDAKLYSDDVVGSRQGSGGGRRGWGRGGRR